MPYIENTLSCPDCSGQVALEPGAAQVEANLDGWTSHELLAEALARTAGDAPALRLMQDVVLEARLTAHDRESAHEHVEG